MIDTTGVVWVIAMLWTGDPVPLDIPRFDTESGCRLYLHTQVKPIVMDSFKVDCIAVPK